MGTKVLSSQPNGASATIDASNLPTGVYIATITTDKGTASEQLIKK